MMKKIVSVLLVLCIVAVLIPCAIAEEKALNAFARQVIPCTMIDAFEESYEGYETYIDVFEGKQVRVIKRDGKTRTSHNFNMYRWSPLVDADGEYIPFETANYLVIDYYYDTPDKDPALLGNRMGWVQGRIVPAESVSQIIDLSWGTRVMSTGMIANEWDQLVISFKDNSVLSGFQEKYSQLGSHYLHQMKLFPLECDMGENDTLYIGDITIQSYHPHDEGGISERTYSFYNSESDKEAGNAAIQLKANDLEYIEIPEFNGTAPEDSVFVGWLNTFDKQEYLPGETLRILSGQDVDLVAVYEYSFDFSNLENAYINGYEDGTFRPQNDITRAEACKILSSLVNPEGENMGKTSFSDVFEEAWYYQSVTTLENLGALGIWEDKFEASTPIKRHELVELVYALSKNSAESLKLARFTDVSADDRYYDAVVSAVSSGIITGYEDGSFKPGNNITRAEAVTVFNRFIGRVCEASGGLQTRFSDIDSHWAKDQIVAASSTKNENVWKAEGKKEYVLEGSCAEEYIAALHEQAQTLSGEAIRRGIDTVAEQMKKDILSTGNTEEYYSDKMTGAKWYVSEKNGDDKNDGRSPETAVKTISGLNSKIRFAGKGTSVLFERGGVYRGQIMMSSGVVYGAYGEGEKPVITTAKKNYADPALWEETDEENVYKLKESIYNVGIIAFDHGMYDYGNYDALYGKNRIYGANISHYSSLVEDLEFFSCDKVLYLRSDEGNPGERFSSIEIGDRKDIFDGQANNVIIDNLSIKLTGAHGIGMGSCSNLTVTNCVFSWLGGSLLGEYGETTTQYGNAVEIYGDCDGYYVKNNWMYQIYDTAVTHQGINFKMSHIEYHGNLMEYVHWGIECWTRAEGGTTSIADYSSRHNVLRNGGYGWGSIVTKRQDSARLYSFSTVQGENVDLSCENTIIDRCAGYLLDIAYTSNEEFASNIYVQDEGKTLGGLKGVGVSASKEAAFDIYEQLNDESAVVVLIPHK